MTKNEERKKGENWKMYHKLVGRIVVIFK